MPQFKIGDRVRHMDDWDVVGTVRSIVAEAQPEVDDSGALYEIACDNPDGDPVVLHEYEFDLARVRENSVLV